MFPVTVSPHVGSTGMSSAIRRSYSVVVQLDCLSVVCLRMARSLLCPIRWLWVSISIPIFRVMLNHFLLLVRFMFYPTVAEQLSDSGLSA